LPFTTFAFHSWGTQQDEDRDWTRTEQCLLEAAQEETSRLSDDYLKQLYGQKTFDSSQQSGK
jgi:hypothetical protein